MNGENPRNPVRSIAQAILHCFADLDHSTPLRVAIAGVLDPVGDQEDAEAFDLLIAASAQSTFEHAPVLARELSKLVTVADSAGDDWLFLLETEVKRLPVRTVVGYAVLRLMLHTELLLLRMSDAHERIEHDLRLTAADQAATWYFG